MVYHLIERHRESGHSRIVVSSNSPQVAVDVANSRRGLVLDADFIVGQHPEWIPNPDQITPIETSLLTV